MCKDTGFGSRLFQKLTRKLPAITKDGKIHRENRTEGTVSQHRRAQYFIHTFTQGYSQKKPLYLQYALAVMQKSQIHMCPYIAVEYTHILSYKLVGLGKSSVIIYKCECEADHLVIYFAYPPGIDSFFNTNLKLFTFHNNLHYILNVCFFVYHYHHLSILCFFVHLIVCKHIKNY